MTEEYTLAYAYPTVKGDIGFHIPIFECSNRTGLFVQSANLTSGTIEAFSRIEDDPIGLIRVPKEIFARVGQEPLYVFGGNDDLSVGTLVEIKASVAKLLEETPTVSVGLQYAELFGSPDELRAARSLALRTTSTYLFQGESDTYLAKSMFLQSLWSAISEELQPTVDPELVHELHRAVLLEAEIGNPGLIPDRLWDTLRPLVRIERDELRASVWRELPTEVAGRKTSEALVAEREKEDATATEAQIDDMIDRLTSIGRQEERIALILEKIIQRPEVGEDLLRRYQPKAKFEVRAIRHIINDYSPLLSDKQRVMFVASLVRRLFTISFPLSRGYVLYFLAHHLGGYEDIARAIRRKLQASHAYPVQMLARQIEHELSKAAAGNDEDTGSAR